MPETGGQRAGAGGGRYDAVVVGGGAAGLGGALALARARRSVLVIDGGEPRNAPAGHVHAYPAREGTPPAELLAVGRAEVEGYGATVVAGTVTSAERLPADEGDGFVVVRDDGTRVEARRLLVATGLVDELPPVPGLAERFGRDVLHCPYCHGWEVRDTPVGILATGALAVHQALLWRQWSDDVAVFAHTAPEFGDEAYEQLAARGIAVVDGEVTGVEIVADRLTGVRLGDRVVPRSALVVAPRFTARSTLLAGLGLAAAEQAVAGEVVGTYVPSDATGATEVPGVWVAGNVTSLAEQVVGAAAAGVRAGAAINADLVAADTAAAVAARRAAGAPVAGAHGGPVDLREHWEARYAQSDRIWSGEPNAELVREVSGLPAGRALDLACGEGGDAVWLAGRGWRVTAADISRLALERAERHGVEAGVGDLIDWQWHDLGTTFPEGAFDLVSAQFLHSEGDLPREEILRRAAAAVAPGGVLLITGHSGGAPWEHGHAGVVLPSPAEVLAELRLEEGAWKVERCEEHERVQTAPDGTRVTRTDNTVRVRRVTK
ncbi:FAD-dependent oxidoreductase [Streptomyces sp. NPDC047002]|uniref:FAD-dependent oxidoreductase n=1 Tax=Streptomyces sp. NPDC047002 TaxID=3155475 RepID=UPI0034537DBE